MIKNLLKKALLIIGIFISSLSFAQSTFTINVGDGGNLYVPANVTCLVGDTIRFVWVSGFHPTRSLDGTTIPLVNMDGSGGINSVYKIKMLTAGTVPYECTAHAGMTGTITVNAPFVASNYVPFTGTGALNANNWSTHSGTAGQLQTITTASDNGSSLAYTGMPTSTGNRTQIVAGNGEDVNRVVPIIPASAGSAYFSALIKLPNTTGQALNTTTGNYFMHFTDSSGTTGVTNHAARLTIRAGSAANTFNIGIINTSGGTASTAAQIFGASPVDYAINQTYLIVVKYTFATNTASLWVNPTISSVEPTPLISNNVGTNTALSKVKSICIRQAGTSTAGTGNIEIDEIRVTNNWNDALGVIPTPAVRFNPTSLTVNENAGTATVTVNITNPDANPTSATVLVKGGTATGGSDYTFTSQTVTFPANSSTAQTFTFPIIDDTNTEGDETIVLALRNATNSATINADSILTITIPSNDQINPSVLFNPTSLTVNENAGTASVTVNVTNPNANPTSATVLVKGGTATAASDYTFTSQTVTFPANSTTAQTFTFPIIDDTNTEGDETIVLALRNATNSATITADSILTITIPANDPLPTLRFNPTSLIVNENAGTATVTLNITNANANPSSGTVLVKGGTATAGADYTFTSQVVTFPANSTTAQTFTFPIIDDTNTEGDETIVLALRNATNSATITADSILTITIPANDVVISNTPILIENFNYAINDTLTKNSTTGWGVVSAASNRIPVTSGLAYPNHSGSGIGNGALLKTSGEDIGKIFTGNQIRSGSVYASFLMNVTSAQAAGDYFFAMLDSALSGLNYRARTFIKSSGTGYRIGISKQGGAGVAGYNSTDLTFGTTYHVVLKYSIIPGTGNDSVKLFLDPVLGAPEPTPTAIAVTTEQDITISSTVGLGGIALRQGSATFAASLTVDAIRAGQTWASVTPFTILNPSVVFNPTSLTVSEDAGTATVTVNLANQNANPTSVNVVVKGGTANGVNDYTFTSQTVTFPANSNTPQSFTFPITNDAAMEPDETIVLALRNVNNSGSIGSDSLLTITIPANDFAGAVVHFTSTAATVNENAGNAQMSIMVMGAGTTSPTSFDVVIKSGTATAGADYTYTKTTYTMPAAKDSTLVITVPVINDAAPEADETAVFAIRNITNSGTISTDSVFTLTIKNDDIAFKNISALRVNDANGVSILKDSAVYIKGIVYGVDMQGSATSLQYTLIDPTGGVGIFRSGASNPPIISLVPEEGDSVKVYGKVGEFNGLTQVNMDSIILISKGNPLRTPRVVTRLDETTESNLVRFNNAQIIDTLANSASGTTLRIVSGTDSMDLRIDADVSLFGQPFPSLKFDVIGIGGQFDNTNPKNSGYQLLPRRLSDIIARVTPNAELDSPSYSVSEAAGTKNIKIKLSSPATDPVSIKVTLVSGSATFTQDYTFTNPTVVNIPAGQSEGTFTFNIINDNTAEQNETINFSLSEATNCVLLSTSGTLTILDNDGIGVNVNKNIIANIYPNPTKELINIESTELINSVEIVNIIGQSVMSINSIQKNEKSIDVSSLVPGVYNVVISTAKGNTIKRMVIE